MRGPRPQVRLESGGESQVRPMTPFIIFEVNSSWVGQGKGRGWGLAGRLLQSSRRQRVRRWRGVDGVRTDFGGRNNRAC